MQGQRSTFAPFSDFFEIGRPSSSGISIMDQQMLRNDLPPSVENQDLPCNPLSSSETISFENVTTQENANMNFWSPLGFSSSISSLNHGSQSETKLESGWTSSAPGNRVGGPMTTDSGYEAMNTLSFETDNAEPSINLVDNRQPSSQFLDFNEPPTENVEMSRQFLETQLHSGPSNQGLSPCQHVPSSGSSFGGSSASAINLFSNYDCGKQKIEESSSHKRKNIKRDDGECSANGHSSNFTDGEEINVRISELPRGATTDHHPYVSASGNSESFQRNTRMKISHANEADNFTPGLWPLENNITCYSPWPGQSSSAIASSSQSLYSGYLGINLRPHRQRNLRTLPAFSSVSYPSPQSEISTMEVRSSLGSPAVTADGSVMELDQLDVPINISEQVSVPSSSTTDMMRDQTNWHSASGSTVSTSNLVPTSQAGSNLGPYQSLGTNWLTHQNRRRISEAIRRNILSSDFEFRGQTISFPQHQNNSTTSQEVGRRGAVSCVHQHPHTRLNMLLRHNSGALGIPLSVRTLAAAEGRNRMSGIRNVFDRIRRGDNLLLEDVLLLEQSAFVEGANFPDRYRDMRLDVDNMSYEELLALGERIGSVNTGLSEEKILECLQQHKYVTVASEPTGEVEPCCICREEYIEGEELGQLDCGHNFHSLCIKKWLVIKNLCPICKTTALST